MKNKRGEETVEAALVLPILILTILSLILLVLYYYSCLNCQTELHAELLAQEQECKAVFRMIKERDAVSSQMDGMVSMLMHKEISGRIYAVSPADMIRAGELIGLE